MNDTSYDIRDKRHPRQWVTKKFPVLSCFETQEKNIQQFNNGEKRGEWMCNTQWHKWQWLKWKPFKKLKTVKIPFKYYYFSPIFCISVYVCLLLSSSFITKHTPTVRHCYSAQHLRSYSLTAMPAINILHLKHCICMIMSNGYIKFLWGKYKLTQLEKCSF